MTSLFRSIVKLNLKIKKPVDFNIWPWLQFKRQNIFWLFIIRILYTKTQ